MIQFWALEKLITIVIVIIDEKSCWYSVFVAVAGAVDSIKTIH